MFRPKCDACGRPAVFHETVIEGNVARESHLCSIHSQNPIECVAHEHFPTVDAETLAALAERIRRERGF